MPSLRRECVVHPRNAWKSFPISTGNPHITSEDLSSPKFNAMTGSTPPGPRNPTRQRRLQRGAVDRATSHGAPGGGVVSIQIRRRGGGEEHTGGESGV